MSDALAHVDMRYVDDQFAVAAQIGVDDVPLIADAGFKTIICNRPDGEAADQTSHTEIEKAALNAGLSFFYIPVVPATGLTVENVEETRSALDHGLPPVLAYCRSGARSTKLHEVATS